MPEHPSAPDPAARARGWIAEADRVCVLTGAGMSAESGIPTFRDAMTGLWSQFDPEDLASEPGYRADPARVWAWYAERREGVRQAQPNPGHLALAAFARARPGRVTVVTQNVDDLHQRAGSPEVIRLHGDILAARWLEPCRERPACAPSRAAAGSPPRCERCGNLLRPDVVWFGEMLPMQAIERAEHAARDCDVMLVVGTSGAVWPAAGLAGLARRSSARVVIVNPNESEIDDVAHALVRGTAATMLPALLGAQTRTA
jgi:NAD-dependent deacetylase